MWSDWLKMCVKIWLISNASSFRILAEMPSGPAALDVLRLESSFWTPGVVTCISCILVTWGGCIVYRLQVSPSMVNTDSNMLLRMSSFRLLSVTICPWSLSP